MRSVATSLRMVPRTVLAFSALHVLVGLYLGWDLFARRCAGDPPLGVYDGCALTNDPWREGHAMLLLASVLLLIAAALWLLRASRLARIVLPVSIITSVYGFYMSLVYAAVVRSTLPDAHSPWVATWRELGHITAVWWLIPICWVVLDSWFLFGSRARTFFQRAA
jgi:phosphate/sulfate permease